MPEKIGLITGVSGVMTKQSYALWSENLYKILISDVTNEVIEIEKLTQSSNKSSGIAKSLAIQLLKKR